MKRLPYRLAMSLALIAFSPLIILWAVAIVWTD